MDLPTDSNHRKNLPIFSGCIKYFPNALAEVAYLSKVGNDKHNPGEPLHWQREKSSDHEDCLVRHLIDSGTIDTDGIRHSAKVAWRALAMLQLEIENDRRRQEPKQEPSSPTTSLPEEPYSPRPPETHVRPEGYSDGAVHWSEH